MIEPITLSSASLRCDIKPDLGGCITGLWLGDLPVLRSTPAGELMSVRLAGSYPLVPFSNRVGHATLKWQGTSHPLVQNNGPEPHAIHGLGWQRPWQVLDQDDQLLMLAFEHSADASWPFAFDASQTFRLSGNTLELTLSMTNQSAMPAPAGLGWHPYFVKRSRSHIAFEATGRWEMNEEKLPTHRQPMHGLDGDCAALDVDHCFDGWNGVVHLRDEKMHTRIASNLGRLVVFTNPQRDFVAIEPVSHVNNAVNLLQAGAGQADELGIQVLAPGESTSAHMSIQVEPAP
ncbi:MAG: aldose 1-epimerase [Polaromonas sp.]|uniref:aldose 1-epimerase n=1 Tax=Polaromonas sp. TaxID=1869339 RepID=UPI00271884F8|nr:aldose 1-epimerase [Polaromonas sp.]MDO9116035.1 aldose 1-epimerase [Polaromonas sp.]MDP1886367.1 aldose 1-epimerase [Polaromonas sp.]